MYTTLAESLLTPKQQPSARPCSLYTSWLVRHYMSQVADEGYKSHMKQLNDLFTSTDSSGGAEDDDAFHEQVLVQAENELHKSFVTALQAWGRVGGALQRQVLKDLEKTLTPQQFQEAHHRSKDTLTRPGLISRALLAEGHGLRPIDATVTKSLLVKVVESVHGKIVSSHLPDCIMSEDPTATAEEPTSSIFQVQRDPVSQHLDFSTAAPAVIAEATAAATSRCWTTAWQQPWYHPAQSAAQFWSLCVPNTYWPVVPKYRLRGKDGTKVLFRKAGVPVASEIPAGGSGASHERTPTMSAAFGRHQNRGAYTRPQLPVQC